MPYNGATVTLSLRRSDEIDPSDGCWRRGEAHVWIGIGNIESTSPDGDRIFADAYLGREDVHILRTFLSRYDEMFTASTLEVPASQEATR